MALKRFIIRDDDLNYFSKPEDVLYWYKELFDKKIPVTLSAVAFVKGMSDVFTDHTADLFLEYPIGNNRELVDFVNGNKDVIEIAQHGCTHETVGGVFEMKRTEALIGEVARAKKHLENQFGSISVFAAPHDAFSNHGILAVESAGLDIVRSKGSKNFLPRAQYFKNICKMAAHRIRNPFSRKAPAYPDVLDYGMHKEAYGYRFTDDEKQLMEWLDEADRRNGSFIIVNHIHYRSASRRELLLRLVSEAQKRGFAFAKASELFHEPKN